MVYFIFSSYQLTFESLALYNLLCPSVRRSIRRSVGPSARVEKWENEHFRSFLCMCGCGKGGWVGRGVWMGVGRPCPPVRNDIVTPRHLFFCYLPWIFLNLAKKTVFFVFCTFFLMYSIPWSLVWGRRCANHSAMQKQAGMLWTYT